MQHLPIQRAEACQVMYDFLEHPEVTFASFISSFHC